MKNGKSCCHYSGGLQGLYEFDYTEVYLACFILSVHIVNK